MNERRNDVPSADSGGKDTDQRRRNFLRSISASFSALYLAACGGSGSAASELSASPSPTPGPAPGPAPVPSPPAPTPPAPSPTPPAPTPPAPTPPPSGARKFSLAANSSGTVPFTVGFGFRQGDIPAGQYVATSLARAQCVVKTLWPDGSVKFALVSGQAALTASVATDVTLSATSTPPANTGLTTADLRGTGVTAAIDCGTFGAASWSGVDWDNPFVTWASGPEMASWLFRKAIGSDAHLTAWLEVRLYAGGAVEVLPWVENGYLLVAGPTNRSATYSFALGGTQRFSQSLDIKHHTRVPLVTGTAYSHWLGADPGLTVRHDTLYLMASGLVPTYVQGVAESAYAFTESYSPNWVGDTSAAMGSAGFASHIGIVPQWAAVYLAGGGDPRAYRTVIANGLAAGAWSVHHRNETTNHVPTFSEFPTVGILSGGSPAVPAGSGGENKKGSTSAAPDTDHQPSLAYLPYLLTGRYFFLEEVLFWSFWNYMRINQQTREGDRGIEFSGTGRGRGWNLRTKAQALSIVPATHSSFASLKASWEANVQAYRARYVDGTRDGGLWKNSLGCVGLYSGGGSSPYGTEGTYWWDAPWMQATIAMAFGHGWNLGLPQSTGALADHQAARDFAYKQFIDRAGDGSPGTWNYRRFSTYALPYSSPSTTAPGTWITSWGSAYGVYEAHGRTSTDFGPLQALPSGTGMYYGDAALTSGDWSASTATAFNLAALVLAAEHKVAGAQGGLGRIMGSSSYALAASAYRTNPTWALLPRV